MSRGAADGESSLEQNLPVQLPQKVLEEQEKQSGEEPPGVEGGNSTLSRPLEGFLQKLNPPKKNRTKGNLAKGHVEFWLKQRELRIIFQRLPATQLLSKAGLVLFPLSCLLDAYGFAANLLLGF